jgi:F-type H+-transporting ATPase subunit delta
MKKTPSVYARELHNAFQSSAKDRWPEVANDFFKKLARARRTNLRARIVAAFSALALGSEGYRIGSVVSSSPLDQATRAVLEKKFQNVVFSEYVDQSLVGGAVVEVEDAMIDGSIKTKLKRLKNSLTQIF